MKKWGALLLAMVMILSCVTAYAAPIFSDVDDSWSWAEKAIKSMYKEGMISGYTDGTYRPGNGVTRLESMLLIARVLGYKEEAMASAVENAVALYEEKLADLKLLYPKEICYLIYNGIFTVEEVRTYLSGAGANAVLKRHEAAFFLTRADGGEQEVRDNIAVALDFEDQDAIPVDFLDYVWYVQKHGIMKGMGDNIFSPLTEVNRAQMAVMLYNISNKKGFTYAKGVVAEVNASENRLKIRGVTTPYTVADNVYIRLDGKLVDLAELPARSEVTLQLENDVVVMIEAQKGAELVTVSGVLTAKKMISSQECLIVRPAGEEEDITYSLSPLCVYTVNGKNAEYDHLTRGDAVTVTLENDLVIKVVATSPTATAMATIEEILISSTTSRLTVSSNGNTQSYVLARGATITLGGEKKSIYDLRLGDNIILTLENNIIVSVSSAAEDDETVQEVLVGKVVSVDPDSATIVVAVTNASDETASCQVRVKDKASIMDAATSLAKDMNAIRAGQSLSIVANSLGDGIYETSAIIILQ